MYGPIIVGTRSGGYRKTAHVFVDCAQQIKMKGIIFVRAASFIIGVQWRPRKGVGHMRLSRCALYALNPGARGPVPGLGCTYFRTWLPRWWCSLQTVGRNGGKVHGGVQPAGNFPGFLWAGRGWTPPPSVLRDLTGPPIRSIIISQSRTRGPTTKEWIIHAAASRSGTGKISYGQRGGGQLPPQVLSRRPLLSRGGHRAGQFYGGALPRQL